MLSVVVGLALLSAFLYALSSALQQRSAAAAAAAEESDRIRHGDEHRDRSAFRQSAVITRRVLHEPLWVAGWVASTIGLLVQAVALHLGSVSLVQALQVTTLLFALPMATAGTGRSPSRLDWLATAVVGVGLASLLSVRNSVPRHLPPHRGALILLMFILVACSAALVVVAGARAGAVRSTLLSVAAGVYFALTAALAKLTMADLFGRGIPATARDWPGYALAAATVVGLVLEQGAFAAGRLPTAVTAMTITNPITGYVLAVGGFGEQLPSGVSDLVVVAMGAALITVGVATLSRCELLHGPAVQRRETSAVPSG